MANQSTLMTTPEPESSISSVEFNLTPFGSSPPVSDTNLTTIEYILIESDTELDYSDSDSNKENQDPEDVGMVEEIVRADQSRKEYTYKERVRVHVLRDLGWTMRQISNFTSIPLGSVHSICTTPATPSKRKGRQPLLSPAIRRRLVEFVCQSAVNRRMPFLEVAHHCG